uniref:Uncharacterized protein n=1 Tax=viral metagenome TaxID=1070528 RepID=A0A2V0R9R6_9ZZZZ
MADKIPALVQVDALRLPGINNEAGRVEEDDVLTIGSHDWSISTTNPTLKTYLDQVVLKLSDGGGDTPLFLKASREIRKEAEDAVRELKHETDKIVETARAPQDDLGY